MSPFITIGIGGPCAARAARNYRAMNGAYPRLGNKKPPEGGPTVEPARGISLRWQAGRDR